MTNARRDSRRDYRHFPAEYAQLLHRFRTHERADLGPMSEKAARAAARDLYRYKMFLLAALEDDTEDSYARELSDIFAGITIRVEPCAVSDGPHDSHLVSLTLNPVVAAVRRLAP